jgi:CHAD domain-containing protein
MQLTLCGLSSSKQLGANMGLDAARAHKPARKLRKLLKQLPKQPDPEEVHELHTNSRRLETLVASLSLDTHRWVRRLLKEIKGIRKKAGGVRDMDVLMDYVSTINNHGEQECRVQLLECLGTLRRKQAKKLNAELSSNKQQTRLALKRVDRLLGAVLCEAKNKNCDPVIARTRVTAAALVLEFELWQPTRLTRQNLHPYRLRVKELQNILRFGERSNSQQFLKVLGAVKDAIGEWHDCQELLGIAKERLDHGAKCELLREIRNLSRKKYAVALNAAQEMREKYLKPSGKARVGLRQTTRPVWEVTAAMAA